MEEILKIKVDEEGESYEHFVDETNSYEPSLLHFAAEHDFVEVSKMLVGRWPSLVKSQTLMDNALPVEVAIDKKKDDTAAYLISQMMWDQ